VERKYVDVNVFVYWLSGTGELLEKAKKWVKAIESSIRGEYITSSLTIYELMIIIAGLTGESLRDRRFVTDVFEAISSLNKLGVMPFTKDIIERALDAMKKFDLDLEDAIHYATAVKYHATKIISNDEDFERTNLQRAF